MGLGDWGGVLNWTTKRIDQVSAFIKKRKRISNVEKIDKSVDSGDESAVGGVLHAIRKTKEDRDKASS